MSIPSSQAATAEWLRINPVEYGRYERKQLVKILTNLENWLNDDSIPIEKISRRNARKQLKRPMNVHQFTPLSRSAFTITAQGDQFIITARNKLDNLDLDLYTMSNQQIVTSIKLHRNGEGDPETLGWHQLVAFFDCVSIANHLLFEIKNSLTSINKKGDIDLGINQLAWNILLAIESLSYKRIVETISAYLRPLVIALPKFLNNLRTIDDTNTTLEKGLDTQRAMVELIRCLGNKNVVPKDKKDLEAGSNNVVNLLHQNAIGRLMKRQPKSNFMVQLGVQNQKEIESGSEEFKLLEDSFNSYFIDMLGVIPPEDGLTGSSHMGKKTTSIREPGVRIYTALRSMEYKKMYEFELANARHLVDLVNGDNKKEITNIRKEIEGLIQSDDTGLETTLELLKKPPHYYVKLISDFSRRIGADAKTKVELMQLENLIDFESVKNNKCKLLTWLDESGIAIPAVHSQLKPCHSQMLHARDCKSSMDKDHFGGIDAGIQAKLDSAQGALVKKFTEHLDKAKKEYATAREQKTIDDFTTKLYVEVNTYVNKIENLQNIHSIQTSSENKALMIGLGEAGENILRATMVKLINSTSDRRCKNMLDGLNLNVEVVQDFQERAKSGFDFKIESIEKDAAKRTEQDQLKLELVSEFDKANILSINMGHEILDKVQNASYNYIFGSQQEQGVPGRFRIPSRNSILIDLGEDGAGGKMGLGRAHVTESIQDVKNSLISKIRGQRVTQVCLVHSFGGGSGSGMILPMLSAIKSLLPQAVVWVFSAGETEWGEASQIDHNVTYITSDVLQSHYNALHHQPEDILLKEWTEFETKLDSQREKLQKKWDIISNEYDGFKTTKHKIKEERSKVFAQIESSKKVFEEMGFKVPVRPNSEGTPSEKETAFAKLQNTEMLPQKQEQVEKFTNYVRTAKNYSTAIAAFRNWMQFSEDPGSIQIRKTADIRSYYQMKGKEDKGKLDEAYFATNYSQFRAFAEGADRASDETPEQFKEKLIRGNQLNDHIIAGSKFNDSTELSDGMLNRHILEYANIMKAYHHEIYQMYERVKLNLIAIEDPLVKHVILSNAHFDVAFKSLEAEGATSLFEVYNSNMVDLFLNIVHSLVANENSAYEEDHVVKSNETMDRNDMLMRTKPTLSATVLNLHESTILSKSAAYRRSQQKTVNETAGYELFERLLENRDSPLWDPRIPGDGDGGDGSTTALPNRDLIVAFYSYYLSDRDGVRNYEPWQVIESLTKDESESPLFRDNGWTEYFNGLDKNLLRRLAVEDGIEIKQFLSIMRWIRLMPPEIFEVFYSPYEKAHTEFETRIKNWKEDHKAFYERDQSHPLYEGNRINLLYNLITKDNTLTTAENENMMTILSEFKIIDASHLACFPSALVYDYAPSLLLSKLNDPKMNVKLSVHHDNMYWTNYEGKITELFKIKQIPLAELAKGDESAKTLFWGNSEVKQWKDLIGGEFERITLHFDGLDYLKVTPFDDVGALQPAPSFGIAPKFLNHFTKIKSSVTRKHPEFSSLTLLENLIRSSSDIENQDAKRGPNEAPEFSRGKDVLKIYSTPKKMIRDEKDLIILIRMLLFGNSVHDNESLKALYTYNVPNYGTDIIDLCQSEKLTLDAAFTFKNFESTILKRLDILTEYIKENQNGLIAWDALASKVITQFVDTISLDKPQESEKNRLKTIFDKLHKQFKTVRDYDKDDTFSESEWNASCKQVSHFCSSLSALMFNLKRQSDFEGGVLQAGSGVTYDYNGTVDAIRSKSDDFLALVNTSSIIKQTGIESSINYYNTNYLETSPRGKVFMFNLDSGPIANITLLSQQSAVTEVSERFKGLMKKLSQNKFKSLKEPFVHPHSFVRNILWLSTFQNKWLHDAGPGYSSALRIPKTVIQHVISQPITIETLATTIETGSLGGATFPSMDRNLFADVQYTSQPIKEGTPHYDARIRGQLQIIDMILINYFLAIVREGGTVSDIDGMILDGDVKTKEIYPPSHYKELFQRREINNFKAPPIKAKSGEATDLPPLPGATSTSTKAESDLWLEALKNWKNYAQSKFDEQNGTSESTAELTES